MPFFGREPQAPAALLLFPAAQAGYSYYTLYTPDWHPPICFLHLLSYHFVFIAVAIIRTPVIRANIIIYYNTEIRFLKLPRSDTNVSYSFLVLLFEYLRSDDNISSLNAYDESSIFCNLAIVLFLSLGHIFLDAESSLWYT